MPPPAATSTEPAIATPSDEPRFDTLRETPEMSPCTSSGHADCTTLTEAVSMAPTPKPMRNRPGQKVQFAESARARTSSRPMPTTVTVKPARTSSRWGCRLAIRWAIAGGQQDADRGRHEHEPGLDRRVAALLLQEDRDHEERRPAAPATGRLGDQAQVRRPVAEQRRRDQRRPAAALARPARTRRTPARTTTPAATRSQTRAARPAVRAGLQDPEDDEEQPGRRQNGARARRSDGRSAGSGGSAIRRARNAIPATTSTCSRNDARQLT